LQHSLSPPCMVHFYLSYLSCFDHLKNVLWKAEFINLLVINFLHPSFTFYLLGPNFISAFISQPATISSIERLSNYKKMSQNIPRRCCFRVVQIKEFL
jgi:hypothetical protein